MTVFMTKSRIFFLIPIVLTLIASSIASADSPLPDNKNGNYNRIIQWSGGLGEGFTLVQIRWGNHHDYERLVLEFHPVRGLEGTSEWPRMEISTEEYPVRMAISVSGVAGETQNLFTGQNPFQKSRFISSLNIYDACDDLLLDLVPSMPVVYDIFSLRNPTRLIIDMKRSRAIPAAAERYSLRTLPLHGDQKCFFLKKTSAKGIDGRLLTDVSGQIIGEVGLYEDLEEAFSARDSMADLGKRFSLIVKTRGAFDTPAEF